MRERFIAENRRELVALAAEHEELIGRVLA